MYGIYLRLLAQLLFFIKHATVQLAEYMKL